MSDIKGFNDNYSFLSNFYRCSVMFDGILYPSSENAYQAAKTIVKEDRLRFVDMTSGKSKREGDLLIKRDNWHTLKFEIMFIILFDKFTRNEDLKIKLLATGNSYLEETNHWGDQVWGVCNNLGENNLGKILMKIREILKTYNKGFII